MLIIPAIDLRGGYCVRLIQGKIDKETIFSKDPMFIAKLFQAQGAKRLHIVDLDGAFSGKVQHFDLIKQIAEEVDIPIEVGGGLREYQIICDILSTKVQYVILGTTVVYNINLFKKVLKRFKKRVIVSLDCFDKKIAIGGWKDITSMDVFEMGLKLKDMGVKEIIYTDIKKDGTLKGPNLKMIEKIAIRVKLPLFVSGGVSTLEDIKKIKQLESLGVKGIIIGKALYTESVKLSEAIKIA